MFTGSPRSACQNKVQLTFDIFQVFLSQRVDKFKQLRFYVNLHKLTHVSKHCGGNPPPPNHSCRTPKDCGKLEDDE